MLSSVLVIAAALVPVLLALLEAWASRRMAQRRTYAETDRTLASGRADRVAARLSELFDRAGRPPR